MISLAEQINDLVCEIQGNIARGQPLLVGEQRIQAARLLALGKLALNIEHELTVLRLHEAGTMGRAAVEKLATDSFGTMMLNTDGKIVRPDFGGKRS